MDSVFGFFAGIGVIIFCFLAGIALIIWAENPSKTETSSHLRESRLQLPCPKGANE